MLCQICAGTSVAMFELFLSLVKVKAPRLEGELSQDSSARSRGCSIGEFDLPVWFIRKENYLFFPFDDISGLL